MSKQQSFRECPNFTNRIVQLKREGKSNEEIAAIFSDEGYSASSSSIQRVAAEVGMRGRMSTYKQTEARRLAVERKKGEKTLKGVEKRLLSAFTRDELYEVLSHLRSFGMSYQEVADFFSGLGYRTSRKPIERLYVSFGISIERSRAGCNNPFYGKHHSDEMRQKASKARKGTQAGDKNPMYGRRGELAPMWAGGKSRRAALFYSSSEWSEKRMEIMAMDGFKCLQCGATAQNKRNFLNVHHIVPLSVDWEARLDNNNLVTLCVDCHKETFGREVELIPLYQDIVRTARRRAETGRNDLSQYICTE